MSEQAAMPRLREKTQPVTAAGPAGDIAVISDFAAFEALKEDWTALVERAAAPHQVFQDFGFLSHWARHYLDNQTRLCVVVARRGRHVAAILPLVRQRRFGLVALRPMGAPIARFNDVLIEPEADAQLIGALRAKLKSMRADFIDMPLVRDDAALVRHGLDAGAVATARLEAPYALLAERVAEDGPSEIYPAKTRSNYRRRLRKLGGDSGLDLRHYQPGPEAAALAHEAIRMKKARLERQGAAAPAVFDPRFEAFFASFANESGGLSSLNVSTLERSGQPIGIDLSFDFKSHSFGHVIATSECAEKDGAGSVLVHHVFATALARGNTTFELLTPADEHKMRHADGVVGVRDLAIPLSLAGQVACHTLLTHGLPAAKALVKKLPPGLARALAARTGY